MHTIINSSEFFNSSLDHPRDTRFVGDIGLHSYGAEALEP
jgi:hypothetical protein